MTRKRTEKEIVAASGAAAAPVRRRVEARRTKPATAVAKTPSKTVAEPSITPAAPSYQETAALAYSYWVARGCQGGSPEEDWLRAEQELAGAVQTA